MSIMWRACSALRESQPFQLFGTAQVLAAISDNAVFDVMAPRFVRRLAVALEETFEPVPGPCGHALSRSRQGAALA